MRRFKGFSALILIILILTQLCACAISVPDPVEMSSADEAEAMGFSAGNYDSELSVGEYAFFNVIIKIDYEYEVKWTSSDPKIATVDSNGRVDALAPGKVTITASAKKASIDYEVSVKKAEKVTFSNSTAFTDNESYVEQNLASDNVGNLYAILVNTETGCATVYTYNSYGTTYNIPVRSMVCSVGKDGATAEKAYNVKSRERWLSDNDGRHYQYVTDFGEYSFSSAPYSEVASASLITEEYNKLGTACTEGNIWLSVSDAKWIYDNCDEGTLIKVTSPENNDPLGVPEVMKLTDNSKNKKWDPTDPDSENPYGKSVPVFSGIEEKLILVNGTFDAYDGVSVYDICGKEYTEGFTVDGSVPCKKEGTYIISYYFTDPMGRTARADRTVRVLSEEEYDAVSQ